jgi:hypothetical protein
MPFCKQLENKKQKLPDQTAPKTDVRKIDNNEKNTKSTRILSLTTRTTFEIYASKRQ